MRSTPSDFPSPSGPVENWGCLDFETAFQRQLERVEAVRKGSLPSHLVLVEHPPVYTLGRRLEAEQHLTASASFLQKEAISVIKTTRGGDITYHGPGQLVAYPIMDLSGRKDLHRYLRELEEVLIRTVASFGLTAGRVSGKTGIWCDDRKLAAIGVAVKHWIAHHGIALNVNPNLEHFTGIIPCGLHGAKVTSMARELGKAPAMESVGKRFAFEFWKIFQQS